MNVSMSFNKQREETKKQKRQSSAPRHSSKGQDSTHQAGEGLSVPLLSIYAFNV